MASDLFLYPNVSRVPGQGQDSSTQAPLKKDGKPSEFDKVFDKTISELDLTKVKSPLKMSAHAMQRLQDRKINLDSVMMGKISDAVDKAAAKGVEDTVVLTPEAALIVSVKNRTIITMLDRGASEGNVFTNIDGAVII